MSCYNLSPILKDTEIRTKNTNNIHLMHRITNTNNHNILTANCTNIKCCEFLLPYIISVIVLECF